MSGLIKATENFKLGVAAATGGIAIMYLINMVMGLFGSGLSIIQSSSTMGILLSGFIVIIAALNLVLDFDFIEEGAEMGAPKYMEWYGAFGLLVTLIWLYLEILRLLANIIEADFSVLKNIPTEKIYEEKHKIYKQIVNQSL